MKKVCTSQFFLQNTNDMSYVDHHFWFFVLLCTHMGPHEEKHNHHQFCFEFHARSWTILRAILIVGLIAGTVSLQAPRAHTHTGKMFLGRHPRKLSKESP